MSVPFIQQYRVGRYILEQKLKGIKRYPLVLMLEPLFRCNLACAGCGKIDYPDEILDKRLSFEDCMRSIDECGAPVVSIAGGEPLIHKDIVRIAQGFIERKKFVYLCTNALLLDKKMDEFEPNPYLTFSIHLDGGRTRHDASVCRDGVYDKCIEVIKKALARGFRVTANCTLFQGETPEEVAHFMDEMMALGLEGVTMAPGYNYERAPQQDVFMGRQRSKQLFRDIFRLGKGRKWRFNQSSMYLDFLAGNQTYECTPWGAVTRNVFGWQKPCYLLVGEGYAPSYRSLIDDTPWEKYGTGRNPKCDNCMMHCGYEMTAVDDTFANPLKAARVALFGPRIDGPMAPELPFTYEQESASKPRLVATGESSGASCGTKRVA